MHRLEEDGVVKDEGSAFRPDHDDTFFDDEDYKDQIEPIRVNFSCEYQISAPAKVRLNAFQLVVVSQRKQMKHQIKLGTKSDFCFDNPRLHEKGAT